MVALQFKPTYVQPYSIRTTSNGAMLLDVSLLLDALAPSETAFLDVIFVKSSLGLNNLSM